MKAKYIRKFWIVHADFCYAHRKDVNDSVLVQIIFLDLFRDLCKMSVSSVFWEKILIFLCGLILKLVFMAVFRVFFRFSDIAPRYLRPFFHALYQNAIKL
jgi:hypothetical protein